MRRRSTAVGRLVAAADDEPDVQPSLVRRQRLQAVAVLLQDESQREAFLAGKSALRALLADCSSASLAVRSGAFECLAALTASDALRQQVKARSPGLPAEWIHSTGPVMHASSCTSSTYSWLAQPRCHLKTPKLNSRSPLAPPQDLKLLPLLLEGAGSGAPHVQQPAAAAVANLCSDPALVVAELGSTPEGLGPVTALALAADEDVQRSASAALWHLAGQPEARALAVQAGALPALLSLAVQQRNVVARELARQALVRCCAEEEGLRGPLEAAAAARGLEASEVAALLKPSSARSFASFAQRNVHHRKLHSGEPVAQGLHKQPRSSITWGGRACMEAEGIDMQPAAGGDWNVQR